MKAMILAAGLGKRMRPLTDHLPKPLLPVGGMPLIEHHLRRLQLAGIRDVVINVSYLADLIQEALGDGERFGLNIVYSQEREPLETGGAINQALPLLGGEPFLLVNGDVWSDYDFGDLLSNPLLDQSLGRLILVPNPEHCSQGNFCFLSDETDVLQPLELGLSSFTFSGMSLLRPELVSEYPQCRPYYPLRESFAWAMQDRRLCGEVYRGKWVDVGTPERLSELDEWLSLSGESLDYMGSL